MTAGALPGEPAASPADDLLTLTLELAGSLDARTVMRRILERSLEVARADRATLSSIEPDSLVIEASVGVGGEVTWVGRSYETDFLLRQPLVAELLATGRPVVGGRLSVSEANPEFREALDQVRHTALLPIVEAGRVAGMLVLSRHHDTPFLPEQVAALTALSALAGLALRNAKLYEEATATARRLQAAADAATDVAAIEDLPALLQRLIAHSCESTGADGGSVMRLDGETGVVEASSGPTPVGSRWPFPAAVTEAIAAGRPIQIETAEVAVDSGLERYSSPYGHALISPMRFSGEVLGIIALARVRGRPGFSAGDIAGLQQFAGLAALVLHSGRLVHRLREAETLKGEFMNIAVHELRGPLTVIEGYTDLLMSTDHKLDPEVERQLATIRRQSAHARTLADDLLILARLESDDLGVAAEVVSLREIAAGAVERALPRARLRDGEITLDADDDVQAVADAALVARVLSNLITNAVAYSVEAPRVRVGVGQAGGRATVSVADNGPGIPDADRERIFARFARGSRSTAVQGSGLGLYLSRECARRMGGDIVLDETAPGSGSRFVLSLPLA